MEHEVKRYRKYKELIKFMLVSSGLWPDFQPRHCQTFFSVLAAFSSAVTCYGLVNFCAYNFTSISVLTRGFGLCVAFGSIFLKVIILSMSRNDVITLNRGLSRQFEEDLKDPENRPHLLAHFHSFSKFFYAFNYAAGMNVIQASVTPLLALRHGKYLRMFPQLMPFTYEPGGAIHWTFYGFELVSAFYLWSITVGVDSAFGYYALHMVGELRLISHRFKNLQSSNNYKKDLRDCIGRHYLVLEAQKMLQRIFGFLAIWLAVTCASIICTMIFQISQTKHMTVYRAVYLLVYCVVKFLQAYCYAWYGNIIAVESQLCLDSIYHSGWSGSGDLQFMNDVLIVQSQKPLIFKAKGCLVVHLDMFAKIVNASLSYFFLLQTLDQGMEEPS